MPQSEKLEQKATRRKSRVRRTRVLLVDDLGLVREGIRAALRDVADIEMVAESANGEAAVRLAQRLKPEVVLLDQDLPDMDGLKAARLIKSALPQTEIIIMTERLNDRKAFEAIGLGATGYILKDIPANNLAAALRSVCHGRAFFHPEVTRKLAEYLNRLSQADHQRRFELGGLTARELEILTELAKGSTDKTIATRFTVSEGTIKTHIRNILRKLNCRNRAQAVATVMRKGLIQ